MNIPPRLWPALFLIALFPPLLWAQTNGGESGTVEGWGIVKFDGQGDLDKAIEASKEKARVDLSANILTYVKVKTVDKSVQESGSVKEVFKRITVTRVVQLLREVDLQKPQIDFTNKVVTTKATVSKAVARQIIADCLAKLKEQEEEHQKNQETVRRVTDQGKYYYKQKIARLENPDDLDIIRKELDRLKAELIKEKLKDVQDVRNAVKTLALKDFPVEDKTTFLAYIPMNQYYVIVERYDNEIFKSETDKYINTGKSPSEPVIPETLPHVAETVLPAFVYNIVGLDVAFLYAIGNDADFSFGVDAVYFHAQDWWGFETSAGFLMSCVGASFADSYRNADDNLQFLPFHVPFEADGLIYLGKVKSDTWVPYVKFGGLGVYSNATAYDKTTNYRVFMRDHLAWGESLGVGWTVFQKCGVSGFSLKTLDFSLNGKYIHGGFYDEGDQVALELVMYVGI